MRAPLLLVLMLATPGCAVIDRIATAPPDVPGDPGTGVALAPGDQPIDGNRFVLAAGQDVIGELQVIETRYEDTFVDIARAYGLGYDELVQANPGVDPWLPGDGTTVVLPTRHVLPVTAREGIVLNIAAKRLFFFPETAPDEPKLVETYPVGIGKAGWATPTGDTIIVSKARDPAWFVPRSVREEHAAAGDPLPPVVPAGPDNPLGRYALGLGLPGYLIHGTNKPAGVGMRVSHGCVRLFPEDIESLFRRVGKGLRVRIVNQPFLLGWSGNDLLLEAHPPLAEDDRRWLETLNARARSSLVNRDLRRVRIDEARLAEIAGRPHGFPVPVLRGRPGPADLPARARRVANTIVHDRLAGDATTDAD